ncbi:rho GTPase-activating protein 31 isoform X1 [Carcharodon carcharias]|uniref:rho GTPase-activating protein 31 isoform X1 n=2 Tax=Carcharodon carcharias TaxID=13397 RepID=UPI001B7DF035|nr:rho GTPase-activating protein 31 isoform X1 [Carcharodon carcharias]XP_041067454.1 rho GTPase-activating protein 31 isoform X1 [Carcharodon carcharias]
MKNKGAKQKGKRKGAKDTAFGCDLGDYLQNSGQDVPQVLKSCAEFIEKHGIVDGVYRLSGITSNIQRLRQEFGTEQRPDLTKEVYLQDIHCVGSLCKLYFRELPNPLLTYELYKKFTEAVAAQSEEEQLIRIQNVIKELPPPHYRTLEYLIKHLTHIASFSTKTNMHSRNLALVWAPNLLRSKEIEGSGYNNDAAFLEVRVQSIVIEFILNHVNQLFISNTVHPGQNTEAHNPIAKCKSLPIVSPSMKLLTLEEAQARTLKPDHPARLEKLHSAPMDTGPAAGTIYHTVIDLPDPRRKLPAKTKKWKSIFNLGRLGNDSKGKLSRNGSVFVRGHQFSEKANIRPAKSMESLCSLPTDDDEKGGRFKHAAALGGSLSPSLKSRTLGSGSSYSLGRRHSNWDQEDLIGAIGGCASNVSQETSAKEPVSFRAQPEQLKVFRGDAFNKSEPTSPKTRRLFYSTNPIDSSPKSNFPGNLFPLEASPRHHRKPMALNISEPFSVSVPLHVSGIISPSATPCREAQNLKDSGLQESANGTSQDKDSTVPITLEGGDRLSEQSNSERHERNDDQEIERPQLQPEPLTDSTNSQSQNQPQPFPNPTCQHSDPLQFITLLSPVTRSPVSLSLPEKTKLDETHPSLVPLTRESCENGHQRAWISNTEEQLATKQDTDSSAKAFMEQLWPDAKELVITEPEEVTAINNFQGKVEERFVQSHDKSDIEDKPLADASVKLKFKGHQRIHSLPDLFLQSPPLMVENNTEELCLNSINNVHSSEESSTKMPDPSPAQPQQSTPTGPLLTDCSKMELTQPLTDENIFITPIESPPIACSGISTDSFISNDPESNPNPLIDPNSDKKHQCPTVPHAFQSSEPCIRDNISNKPEPDSETDVNHSGTCSEDVLYMQRERTKVNLFNDKSDQKGQLADNQSNQKCAASQIDTSELLLPEAWMDNDTLKQPSSHSSQLGEATKDEEGCLSLTSPIVIHGERLEILSPDACIEIIAPEDFNNNSSQFANNDIDWNSQSPETSLQICNGDSLKNSSLVTKSVNFPDEVEGISTSNQLHILLTEDNSLSSKESESLCVISAGSMPCLESTETESVRLIADGNEEGCLKSNDKASLLVLYPMVNDKSPLSDGYSIQSIPIGVTAVRMTYMIKTCQVKAIPVIPPKLQFTQVPQPLPKNNLTPPSLPLDKVLTILQPITACEQSSPENKNGLDSSLINPSVAECKDGKENGLPKFQIPEHTSCAVSPETSLVQSKTTEAAPIVKRTCKANGEDVFDSPTPSRVERSPVQQKPGFMRHAQHRSKAGRPQSLILFSPPWPSVERPSSIDSNKVHLSPVQSSPEQQSPSELDHLSPSSYPHELNDSQKGPDGVTLRSRMSMPKSGQRLETSTSCFYQPQRRSMIFENRGGRQIE